MITTYQIFEKLYSKNNFDISVIVMLQLIYSRIIVDVIFFVQVCM